MIVKEIRTGFVRDLVDYLVGPGHHNEHTNPTLVAADPLLEGSLPTGTLLSKQDAAYISEHITTPYYATHPESRPFYIHSHHQLLPFKKVRQARPWQASHIIYSADKADGDLTNQDWENIVYTHLVEAGLINPDDRGAPQFRWVAINHGATHTSGLSHVHLVIASRSELNDRCQRVNLPYKDRMRRRLQAAATSVEHTFGLRVIESRIKKVGARGWTRAEKARRDVCAPGGLCEREELKRRMAAAATAATSETDYIRQLIARGVDTCATHSLQLGEASSPFATGYTVQLADYGRAHPAGRVSASLTLRNLRIAKNWHFDEWKAAWPTWQTATKTPHKITKPEGFDPSIINGPAHHPGVWAAMFRANNNIMKKTGYLGEDRWRDLARQTGAGFAALSLIVEKDTPGPLWETANALYTAGEWSKTLSYGVSEPYVGIQRATAWILAQPANPQAGEVTTRILATAVDQLAHTQTMATQRHVLELATRQLEWVRNRYHTHAAIKGFLEPFSAVANRHLTRNAARYLPWELQRGAVVIGPNNDSSATALSNLRWGGIKARWRQTSHPDVAAWLEASRINIQGVPAVLYNGQFISWDAPDTVVKRLAQRARQDHQTFNMHNQYTTSPARRSTSHTTTNHTRHTR